MKVKSSKSKVQSKRNVADFLFEAASLKRLKRTGWQILGENEESIAEHSFMVCVISFILAKKLKANLERVLVLALFHDFAESRTGDVYKLADLYVKVDEKKAIKDAFDNLPKAKELVKILQDYQGKKSLEDKIVHDADVLSLCIELKQLIEQGNSDAKGWFEANIKALKLKEAEKMAQDIKKTNSQDWWKKERNILHQSFGR